jgi:hypothetical protein
MAWQSAQALSTAYTAATAAGAVEGAYLTSTAEILADLNKQLSQANTPADGQVLDGALIGQCLSKVCASPMAHGELEQQSGLMKACYCEQRTRTRIRNGCRSALPLMRT